MAGTGYNQKHLHIDLSSGATTEKPIAAEVLRDFSGGRGLGIKLLWDLAPKGVDPLARKIL
jgi:aldehyde:ferredoxin oxidoreductase